MKKIKVANIKLRIVRGRAGPAERRFQYSTLVEYILEDKKEGKRLIMGIIPSTYFFLKQVLKEDLNDFERVIYHNIKTDSRIFLQELFIQNNLLNISVKKQLTGIIDEVVIDNLKGFGQSGYNFSASIYLNNGQRIPNVIPSDALVIGILAEKDIYIEENVLKMKEDFDKEIEEKIASKKETGTTGEDKHKKPDIPKSIYT